MVAISIVLAVLCASLAACYVAYVWRSTHLIGNKEAREWSWRFEVLKHEQSLAMAVTRHQHKLDEDEYQHECSIEEMEKRLEIEDTLNRRNLQAYTGITGHVQQGSDEPDDAPSKEFAIDDFRVPK